ncbi:MAG: methyltransferase [Alphaproteobacteria bacterium]|jgi:FkbM family methyltransferase
MSCDPTTLDGLLDGRVRLSQPTDGYRVAMDAVMLAAAVPARARDHVVDLGAGAGAASLCLAARLADCRITAIEVDPFAARLARDNAALNDAAGRITVIEAAIETVTADQLCTVDHVMANPPYLPSSRAAPSARGDRATVEQDDIDLAVWIRVALTLVRAKGSVSFIQRADRLDDLIAGLRQSAGEIIVYPLWPKAGRAAKRVLVRARRNVSSPLSLKPGMVLHRDDGAYTAAAESVLRHAKTISME